MGQLGNWLSVWTKVKCKHINIASQIKFLSALMKALMCMQRMHSPYVTGGLWQENIVFIAGKDFSLIIAL